MRTHCVAGRGMLSTLCLPALLGLMALSSAARAEACSHCDLNADFVVDQADVEAFTACMNGPFVYFSPGCDQCDLDSDSDVDQEDFGLFQTCFGLPAGPTDPVISEFMAINDNVIEDEDGTHADWIEIHNPTDSPVDLAGWYLTDSAANLTKWQFPAVSIPAGGYLLVWASDKDRAVVGQPLHANFKLSGDGEYLALIKPDGTTVASQYAPVFPPQSPDVSYGMAMSSSSATLVTAGAPCRVLIPAGNIGTAWTNLPFDDVNWTLGMTGVGYERNPGDTINYVSLIGTDVGAMYNVNQTVYIRVPFEVTDPGAFDELVLRMKYDDGFAAYINGEMVAWANQPDPLAWNSGATGLNSDDRAVVYEDFEISDHLGALRAGTNVLAIQGLNSGSTSSDLIILPELQADSDGVLIRPRSLSYFMAPTPGEANVGGVSTLGPLIANAAYSPIVPTDSQNLTVTAEVSETLYPVGAVQLHYRVMYGSVVDLAMADDGLHGDGAAGDGVYGAIIPASASTPGQMVRWYFTASDTAGNTMRWPLFNDPTNSPEYLGTVVANPSVSSQLPILQWFVGNASAAETLGGTRCSVFFNDEFYDNVFVRIRGNTSSGWPKHHHKFDFNSGNHFRFDPNLERVEEFNLNSTYSDKAYLRAVLAAETYRDAGAAYSTSFPMRVQQNGAFFSVAIFVEQPDEDYLARQGLDPSGALYKMADFNIMDSVSGAEKKTRLNEGNQDLQALIAGIHLTGSARTNYMFDNVDVPACITYWAATTLMHDNDHPAKNYYMYRDTEGSGEWQFLPWDKDLTFGRNFTLEGGVLNDTIWANQDHPSGYSSTVSPSHPLFADSDHQKADGWWNHMIDALSDTPEIRAMYVRRLRTLMDAQLNLPGTPTAQLKYETRIDQLVSQMQADVALDRGKWGSYGWGSDPNQSFATAISILKTQYLAVRRTHLFNTHGPSGDALIPAAQSSSPSPSIQFGAIEHSPSSGIQDEEYIQLVNANTVAVDISGWGLFVDGELKHTFRPGTVIRAGSSLYATPNTVAFRARSTSPKGGEGRFIQGNYHNHIAPGEVLSLRDVAGVEVATVTVGS